MDTKKLINQYAIKAGLAASILYILLLFGSWAIGIAVFVKVSAIYKLLPVIIILLLIFGFQLRKQNGGFILLAEVLKFAFLAYVIYELVYAASNYLLYSVIDKGLSSKVLAASEGQTRTFLKMLGMPQASIDDSIEQAKSSNTSGMSWGQLIMGFGGGLILDFILGIGVAAIVQKKPANIDNINSTMK